MAAYFIKVSTGQIFDYFQLKSQPEFNDPNDTPGWPYDSMLPSIDGLIQPLGFDRMHDTPAPIVNPWEMAEKGSPVYKFEDDKYQWNWQVRNKTQPELDALNAENKMMIDLQRKARYQEEADPLFFKAQRQETTSQEWRDKCDQIMTELPDPPVVVIP